MQRQCRFPHKLIKQQIDEHAECMSHCMRKPTNRICENKAADQLCSKCTADQHLCFRCTDSTKVQVGKDQEKAQSEKDSHSKNRGGKKPN